MPKIGLRYTGSDEREVQRLKVTKGVRYFEPVDAREVLATPGAEYEPDEESRAQIGRLYDPRFMPQQNGKAGKPLDPNDPANIVIPQLHGDDAELQTGLSHNKYGRSQVVKAVVDPMMATTHGAQSTIGRPLDLSKVGEDGAVGGATVGVDGPYVAKQEGRGPDASGAHPSADGMTKQEIQSELDKRGVQYEPSMRKDDLAALLESQGR